MPGARKWEVEFWTNSGVHTGYRVIRYSGLGRPEIAKGFVGNMYREGSMDRAKTDAEVLCAKLNSERI